MAELSLVLLSLLWGTTFTFVKQALQGTSPAVFLSLRFALAGLCVAAFWAVRRDRAGAGLLRDGGLLGLAMFGGYALQTFGLRLTTASRSGFLTGLAVLFVPFLARFLFRRAVSATAWGGVALALAGLLVMTRPFGGDISEAVRLGDALSVGCALCFAFQVVLTAEWSARHALLPFTLIQIVVTGLGSASLIAVEPATVAFGPALLAVVLFTGMVMTAAAFSLQNWAQRHTTAVRAALIFALEPVAAALFAWLWAGDVLLPEDWIGGGMIVGAVVLAEVGGAYRSRAAQARARELARPAVEPRW